MITWSDFEKIDMRVGTILEAREFPEARKPAYQILIDFGGDLGKKRSSAQITAHYKIDELIGRQVIAVVNFPKKSIAGFKSECLILGVYDENNAVILLEPRQPVKNGQKIG